MSDDATCKASYFEELYLCADPFGYRSTWYEERKREILRATLPRRTFVSGWEIGCSNGELTAVLATRCRRLLATDISQRAVELARVRNKKQSNVIVERSTHPREWPRSNFDLIVLSEVGYYFGSEELDDAIDKIQGSLSTDGLIVACHWLAPFQEAPFTGRQVHSRIDQLLPLEIVYRYEDGDFLLEAWGSSTRTLAQLEGLK